MTYMIKRWSDGGNRLDITNNQYAPNRYSKAYLIKDNICKLWIQLNIGDELLPVVYHHHSHLLTRGDKETAAVS